MIPTVEELKPPSVYERMKANATGMVVMAKAVRGDLTASMPVLRLLDLYRRIRGFRKFLVDVQGTAGLQAHMRTQLSDGAYDLAASLTAIHNAGQAILNWLEANLPSDGSGGVVVARFVAGEVPSEVSKPSTELTPLGPLIDTFTTSITG